MKKITALILSLALVFSLAACGGSKTDAPAQDNSNDATASSAPTPTAMTFLPRLL